MRKLFIKLLLIFFPAIVFAQTVLHNEIGLPLVRNYSTKEYKAFSQNWGFAQDNRGVLYFANGDGVLEYDGVHWRVIKIANDYSARSIAIDNNNRIYIGSTSEFGYLTAAKNGALKYKSLLNKFDIKDRKFKVINKLFAIGDKIYFIAGDKLFCWNNEKIKSWHLQKPCYCYKINNHIFIWQQNLGLKTILKDSIVNIKSGEFFSDMPIQNILPYKNNRMLVITRDSGIFVMSDPFKLKKGWAASIFKFYNQADYYIESNQLLYSSILKNGNYAFSTLRGGTAIMNSDGALVQILDKSAGVQNETHNSVGQDKQNALWLLLDNGITRADISSPLSFWNDDLGLKGSVLSVIRFKDKIYAGTWQGLFYYNFSPGNVLYSDDMDKNISRFEMVNGIKSTCWDLLVVKNEKNREKDKLLVASSSGVYEIDQFSAKLLMSGGSVKLFRSEKDPSVIYVGTDDGVKCISVKDSGNNIKFKSEGKIKGCDEKIISFEEDSKGRIWISSEFSGIYMLEFKTQNEKIPFPLNERTSYSLTHYTPSLGIPEGFCQMYKVKNSIVVISKKGIYFPIEIKKDNKTIVKFASDVSFLSKAQNRSSFINFLVEDKKGNIWLQLVNKALGTKTILEAIPLNNGYYSIKLNPFKPIPQTEIYSIFPEPDNNTWFGGDDGLIKYDGNVKYEYNQEFNALIRKVVLERDSVLFGGTYCKQVSDSGEYAGVGLSQPEEMKPEITFSLNSLTFEYSASTYYDGASRKYKIYLEGFDKKWSEWTNETKKEYTNLPPGTYKFHVIAKNIFDAQSTEAIYEFEILPPWYRTWFAYFIYLCGIVFALFSIIRFSNKRLRDAKIRLEEVVKERTSEINEQKKELEKEKEKSDKLLLNILPFKIAEELKANGHAKTKFFDQVTVMFSDFKDFTVIAQQLDHEELIAELNRCFMFFDDVCVRHNIEKIKTVGDSFMCAGGIPIKNTTNPVDVVLAAFEMRDFISRLKKEQATKGRTLWKIRIGINTGEIISGVVGKKKFAYDIWGDTVNTASRLEQASFPNKINISGSTFELVKDFFDCTPRGKIPVKHKGEIDMYFADRIKEDLSVDDEGRVPNQKFWELYEKINQ